MFSRSVIGVDLGGTKIGIGRIDANNIMNYYTVNVSSQDREEKVLHELINSIDKVFNEDIAGIGIGVPSLVDVEKGIVYDVQNIPSWKEVHLKEILEAQFHRPVYVNNDANCFAVGEKYFGKGKKFKNMVGLIVGTGLGAGIIINNHLYSGFNCGAGEFGSIPYRDQIYEYYCSGQFFKNVYNINGETLFNRAEYGDSAALEIFAEFGAHLGNAILSILFTIDPEAIILGGSVSRALPFFQETMWDGIKTFPYQRTIERLVIERTEDSNIAVLGAAALFYDAQNNVHKSIETNHS
jgi:glucokinase